MRRVKWRSSLSAACAVGLLLAACNGDEAEVAANGEGEGEAEEDLDLDEYFDGQTVTVITGSSPGGGYDHTMRTVAQFIPDAFEEVHGIQVDPATQNVTGGQQLRSMQHMWNLEPDGFTVGLLQPRYVIDALTGGEEEGWDLDELQIIGVPNAPRTSLTCMDPTQTGLNTWEELLESDMTLRIGDTQPGSPNSMAGQLVELAGGPIEMIWGYDGTPEHAAAFDRGELDGTNRCPSWGVLDWPDWVEDGRLSPLFWALDEDDPDYLEEIAEASGGNPNPPHVLDLPGMDFSQAQRDGFQAALGITEINRALYAVPGTSDEIIEYLREVFYHIFQMPEYAELLEEGGVDHGWMTGEDAHAVLDIAGTLDEEGLEIMTELGEQ